MVDSIVQASVEANAKDAASVAVVGGPGRPGVPGQGAPDRVEGEAPCLADDSKPKSSDDGLGIPLWLDKNVSPETRQSAWETHRLLIGTPTCQEPYARPRVRLEEKTLDPVPRDLYAENLLLKKQKKRAQLDKFLARKSGDAKAMPLSGKDALRAIREGKT